MINDGEEDQLTRAAKMVVDMIIMSHRFDNELTGDKGVGRVFNKLCKMGTTVASRQNFHLHIWLTINKLIEENSDDFNDAGMDILLNFGKHLMSTAYGKLPALPIHDEEMDNEE